MSYAPSEGYRFIDNARFISMLAIVIRHCELSLYASSPATSLAGMIAQFRTFGVQLFFVSSAFLLADWLVRRDDDIRGYWKSRWNHVAIPWVIWVGIYIAADLFRLFMRPEIHPLGLVEEIFRDVFYQSYWFVPILLFSLAVLLPLRRYWRSGWLGLALLVFSLIYGINQYARWFPPSHTLALFGYLFPLWVGLRLFQGFGQIKARVDRTSWWPILALLCLSFSLTLAEDRVMLRFGFPDTYNALQISNQLYSFAVLLVLLKTPVNLVPSFIDVRKDTYGIYLTHQVVALLGRGAINFMVGTNASNETLFMRLPELVENPMARLGLWVLWTAIVYGVSLGITKLIRRTPLAWVVGPPDATPKQQPTRAARRPIDVRNSLLRGVRPPVVRSGTTTPRS